jgi:hypothetical protein
VPSGTTHPTASTSTALSGPGQVPLPSNAPPPPTHPTAAPTSTKIDLGY